MHCFVNKYYGTCSLKIENEGKSFHKAFKEISEFSASEILFGITFEKLLGEKLFINPEIVAPY